MSHILYRWGRWAASHAWRTVGIWVVLAVAVTALASTAGHALDNTMEAPGTDSAAAAALLDRADTGTGGLTAYVVATLRAEGESFLTSPSPARPRRRGAAAPGADGPARGDRPGRDAGRRPAGRRRGPDGLPDGRVAIIRLQYPVIGETDKSALAALSSAVSQAGDGSDLRLEAGGDPTTRSAGHR